METKGLQHKIPAGVVRAIQTLKDAGFEAFVVGGCVRDLFLDGEPSDWDLTTNAVPDDIMHVFENAGMRVVYENTFGTVAVIDKDLDHNDPSYAIEVTPYRTEGTYSDNRRPDEVLFSTDIHEDLKRRDFTINAMAYDPIDDVLIDDFDGQGDLVAGTIRTVGDANERFTEDALRIVRAVRFSAQLGFVWDMDTAAAIRDHADRLANISAERLRDEFMKIVDAPFAMDGIISLHTFGLLSHIAPELEEGIGCDQGGAHAYDVWTHALKSLEHGTNKGYPLYVKFAALFHDVGKPRTRREANGRGTKEWTFYGHEVVGAKMVREVTKRLRLSKEFSDKVYKLVRYHMFFSDPDAITLSAVRRMVRNVGQDLIWDLMDLRTCDRIGTGRPKEKPYRLRKYHAMIEEVMRDPISVGMLKINGDIMVGEMGLEPGPKMGWVLHALLEEVLEDPKLNTLEYLRGQALKLFDLPEEELKKLGQAGKEKKDEEEFREVKKLHRKHKVD